MEITPNTPVNDLTIGGNIYEAGNARNFKTGDWRSVKPVYLSEKCKQCGLCFPVCPDDSIPVNKEQYHLFLFSIYSPLFLLGFIYKFCFINFYFLLLH